MFVPEHHNVIMEILSQECVESEWTLNPVIFENILQLRGSPYVDLFAMVNIKLCVDIKRGGTDFLTFVKWSNYSKLLRL